MDDVYMLTTIDNPFSPFTQYDEWYAYDVAQGHHTCSYLARIVKTSDDISLEDELIAIDNAIDEIIKLNINGLYRRVKEQDYVVV